MNTLYYGDNLKILQDRNYFPDACVDLIYLDPPFNSNRNYNVLFKNESGIEAESQITAFEDTWHWNASAEETFRELQLAGDEVATMIESFRGFIGDNQMMAYLVMMAIRLKELHRVLKPTGSLYLHCDPTASHYLKILLDTIFGADKFRTEIIWKRTTAHSNVYRAYGDITDTIFFYTKSENDYTWTQGYRFQSESDIEKAFPKIDADGRRWRSENMRNPGIRPNLHYPYTASNGVTYLPHPNGWTVSLEKMKELDRQGKLHFPTKEDGRLRLKYFADTSAGIKLQNLWDDISPIGAQAAERLGYPTQKPVALLERIVAASSNEGDIVLDPFCGCGTTIAAAQKLGRQWIGIDITHLSIALQKYRLKDAFGLDGVTGPQAERLQKENDAESLKSVYRIIGEPDDLASAQQLATEDRYQFQWWALSLIKARPLGGSGTSKEGKKGSDKGIDGTMVFVDDTSGKAKRVIVQVKSGKVKSGDIRDLAGTIDRENADIGIFLTLENPSRDMTTEAVGKGFYHSKGWNKDYPKLQILTIEELLDGKQPELPPNLTTFKQAEKIKSSNTDQWRLGFE